MDPGAIFLDTTRNVHIKQESDVVGEYEPTTEQQDLYADHEIKEEMVIGPLVLQRSGVKSPSCRGMEVKSNSRWKRDSALTKSKKNCLINTYNSASVLKVERETVEIDPGASSLDTSKDVHIKQEPDVVNEYEPTTEQQDLYADHEIKEEMVIGPVVLQRSGIAEDSGVETTSCSGEEVKNDSQEKRDGALVKSKKSCLKNTKSLKHSKTRHSINHNGNKPHVCDICKRDFLLKINLTRHLTIHTGAKPHACDFCNKRYNLKSDLYEHLKHHTGGKPYVCDICKSAVSLRSTLIHHLLIHTGEKRHVCGICNKRFTLRGTLTRHSKIHTGERPHVCDICNRRFILKWKLKEHLNDHTRKKKINKSNVCDICNKYFTQKGTLTEHLKIHTGEKPHLCQICNKSFKRKWHLNQHSKIHTGKKPYVCDICNKHFTRKGSLTNHLKIHYRERPPRV